MADFNKYHNGQSPSNGHNGQFRTMNEEGPEQHDNDTDFKQFFYSLWNRKWIILGSIFICGIIAAIIAFSTMPIYQADGSMLIEESKSSSPLGGSEGIGQLLSSTYGLGVGSTIANELQVLKSRRLSEAIADSMMEERIMPNGRQFPVLFRNYPDDSTMTSQDTVAARIRKNIAFERVDREAKVVGISYESPAPYETAHVVNLSMQLYKDLSTQQNRSSANSAVSFLRTEKNRIQNNLEDAEENLRKFMNKSKLVQVEPQTQKLIEQIADLEARRQEAKAKLVAVNSAINQYESQLNGIKPGLAEQYSEAVGPNITKLQYAKSELQLQKQQLLAKNPRLNDSSPQIQELNRKIKSYKDRIKQLTQNLINQNDQYLGFLGGAEGQVAGNISELNQKLIEFKVQQKQYQSQISVISSQLKEQQQFFNGLPDNIIDLAKLKRDVKINEELYVTVSQQYAKTALWEQTQFGLGRIVDKGYIPKEPIKPNKSLYVLVGFILGGILSISYVLAKDAFNTKIDGVEKIKKRDEPLLSVIPAMDEHIKETHGGKQNVTVQSRNISTNLISVLDTISPITESFRRLENNLIYSNPDSRLKSILVTSSAKGEGKTTTISNLGVVLSEAGYKTIIIDTDFRRPNLHNVFGLKKTPGFIEILFDNIDLQDVIKETVAPGLSILPAGRRPPNPSVITQSHAFLNLLEKLESEYDFVLIDTPPIGIITDASAMLRHTDGVAVIAKFNETTEVQLSQTLEQLHRLNANVLGTVLTAFDHTKSKDYYLSSTYYKDVYKDYDAYQEEEPNA